MDSHVSRRDRPGGCGKQNGFPGKCCLSDSGGGAGIGVRRGINSRQKQDNTGAADGHGGGIASGD